MNNSMISASASMGSLQKKLDLLADNIANSNTVGYKRKTAIFEDILTNINPHLDDFNFSGRRTPLGFTQGWGAKLSTMQLDFSQGVLQQTGNATDIAIEGNGLFEVRTGTTLDSSPAVSRHGALQLMATGNGDSILVTNAGYPVVASVNGADSFINVPSGYQLSVAADGKLTAIGSEGMPPIELGQLKLVQATKPELLQAVADNLYGIPENVNWTDVVSDVTGRPSSESGVAVRQGFVENSNVDMAEEMTDLVMVQRAYQLTARALSSSEQMMGMANNLRA
ncbi:MAG: flagellar hook-basal body protein [Candidatus Cohnella colombiensis]|uniref:Flagellar hook-basal body protein n=1 Tax=Candidatus Cohnella colombiensis TaxID=3121368 RepID=A0AA95EYZ0_9BACL|nr:MAG: flagellar hook-basal body protein [Cohnella sp.]